MRQQLRPPKLRLQLALNFRVSALELQPGTFVDKPSRYCIMPLKFLGLSVWITSNGAPLEEYKTTTEEDNSTWCIIPSVAGETFQICWDDRSENLVSLVACYMDGRSMGGMPSHRNSNGCNDGVRISEWRVKPFRFSSVITTGK